MREILFRGKSYTGAWVEGAYYKQTEYYGDDYEDHIIITTKDELEDNMMTFYSVLPETVGQFTGLTKNGTKIFEGDIGTYKHTDGAKRNGKPIICTGKVIYWAKTASYAVDSKDEAGRRYFDYFPIKDFEIIGNIHDNPELLEGGME